MKREGTLKNNLKSRSERIFMTVIFCFCIIFSVLVFYPFLWMLFNMLKTKQEFFFNPSAVPKDAWEQLKNFSIVFVEFDFVTMILNTMYYAVVPPLVRLMTLTGAAYVYAMFDFPGKKICYWLSLLPMLIMIQGSQTGTMKLYLEWGLYDNMFIAEIITSFSAFGYNFLFLSGYFSGCSRAYREAAEIDGAGRWQTYLQIYFPMAVPFLTAFFVLDFVGCWNNWSEPMIFYPSIQTLATGVFAIQNKVTTGGGEWGRDYPKLFCAIFMLVIPCICLYTSVQGIVRKINIGSGVKG